MNTSCCSTFVYLDYATAPSSAARLVACRCRPPPQCCSIVRIATNIITASSCSPPLFTRSSRHPQPTLATANRRCCRPTALILALLHPPLALLLVVARSLPAPIVVVGARKGRGVDAAGALLVPKIGPTKARLAAMACRLCLRPAGRAAVSAVVFAPCPDVVFVVANEAMIVTVRPPPSLALRLQ